MLASQLSGCNSIRDLEVLMNTHTNALYHLGLSSVKRSTLSDANRCIDFRVFRDIASKLLERLYCKKQELSNLVTVLDSSTIKAHGRGSKWALGPRTGSKGLKLHIQFDDTNEHIEYVEVTDGNINDLTVAQGLALKESRIYVFDKGYVDYNWWLRIIKTDASFVSRLKKNAKYRVLENLDIKEGDKGFVLKDQIIELTNKYPRADKVNELAGHRLRLLSVTHPDPKRRDPLIIVSNDCESEASQVAGWYKQRWSVELVFKWLKQNLKLRKFIGENRNALMIQIYVAMIAYVLLKLFAADKERQIYRLKDMTNLVKNSLFCRLETQERLRRKREKEIFKNPLLFNLDSFERGS
jgi:hypothetical protein